jgi:hypothetical protein
MGGGGREREGVAQRDFHPETASLHLSLCVQVGPEDDAAQVAREVRDAVAPGRLVAVGAPATD